MSLWTTVWKTRIYTDELLGTAKYIFMPYILSTDLLGYQN